MYRARYAFHVQCLSCNWSNIQQMPMVTKDTGIHNGAALMSLNA